MSHLPETRQSLLIELGRRSDDAWVEFLRVYEHAIYRLCRGRGLQDADARDVTQEVLEAVHRRVASWDHGRSKGSFSAWLLGVARNISIDAISASARRAQSLESAAGTELLLDQIPSPVGDPGQEYDLEYRRALFEWAAGEVRGEVRPGTWAAFRMTAIEGLGAQRVARELGIPVGSVYTAKCRVVARIRAKVEGLLEDSDGPLG